jgi:UDP-GlcNAc:undecaprenyl-phosphate/decaprenyl-phosphate GlcNAc-1-phosphate transferase
MLSLNFTAWIVLSLITIFCIIFTITGTKFSINYSKNNHLMDDPKSASFRKQQKEPIPLLGGTTACFIASFAMGVLWLFVKYNWFGLESVFRQNLEPFRLVWVIVAVALLLIGGFMDDKYQMNPKYQVLFILLAIGIVFLGASVKVDYTSYTGSLPFIFSAFLTYTWLGFCTASTKFLDGHDGLVSSVGIISFATIASVTALPNINQPLVFAFCWFWIVCLSVFAFWNLPNATSYLGEGASEVIGFMIGVLAILSGAKVVTAFCILGWFILDILLVWSIRISQGRNPLTSADRNHWHHRLLDMGLNKMQVLIFTWIILLCSSYFALFANTYSKIGFLVFEVVTILGIYGLSLYYKKKIK